MAERDPSENPQPKPGKPGEIPAPTKDAFIANLKKAAKSRRNKLTPGTREAGPAGDDPSQGIPPPQHGAGRGF